MVKGSTRQVILVKSPDPKLFEEAIFIVREEALKRQGVTAEMAIQEARQAADGYLKGVRAGAKPRPNLAPLWLGAGAVLASLGWGTWLFLL